MFYFCLVYLTILSVACAVYRRMDTTINEFERIWKEAAVA